MSSKIRLYISAIKLNLFTSFVLKNQGDNEELHTVAEKCAQDNTVQFNRKLWQMPQIMAGAVGCSLISVYTLGQ